MLRFRGIDYTVEIDKAFNSLFEMRARDRAGGVSVLQALSILYLRCPQPAVYVLSRRNLLKLSILYLRCSAAATTSTGRGFETFNSLFEMPGSRTPRGDSAVAPAPFNSLFEMHASATRQASADKADILSILYLRCRPSHHKQGEARRTPLSILYLRC